MDIITYALTKKIAEAAASGIERMWVEGLTLYIQPKEGDVMTIEFPTPEDGKSIINVMINEDNHHLICTMSDSSIIDAGELPVYIPQKGVDYYTEEDKEEIVQDVLGSIDTDIVYADEGLPTVGDSSVLYVYNTAFYRWQDSTQSYVQLASGASIDWDSLK